MINETGSQLNMDDDIFQDESVIEPLSFPVEVQLAIEQVLPSTDPLDQPEFSPVDYINSLFPTEQSLVGIDETIAKIKYRIHSIDDDIRTVVRGQTNVGKNGHAALEEAQNTICDLLSKVRDIKLKAEDSESMVREITRDIKTLDTAKRNLTASITTLNHLHMLVGGVNQLKTLVKNRQYSEIAVLLEGVMSVLNNFQKYMDIPQIKQLNDQVQEFRKQLASQINADFHDAFSADSKQITPSKQLAECCLVVSVLDPKVKKDLLSWFVDLQLEEYKQLFQDNQEVAWLDKMDRRYAWIKRNLIEFEERSGRMFPVDWEVSERIAVRFCELTKSGLDRLMKQRKSEIDVKLLLYAIQKTTAFEALLSKRFLGVTLSKKEVESELSISVKESTNPFEDPADVSTNPFEEDEDESYDDNKSIKSMGEADEKKQVGEISPFQGIISKCFEPHLDIYVDSQDRTLGDLIEKFIQDSKVFLGPGNGNQACSVLPSCADLFLYYKKCLIQCTQLSTGIAMVRLTSVFQKHLKEYAVKVLQGNLPKATSTLAVSNFRDLAPSGIIQNFQSLLKEGEVHKFTSDELWRICSILTTAEYCLDTTQQLESKLKEKICSQFQNKVNLAHEIDTFDSVILSCIHLLVQDLESSCESAVNSISKEAWQSLDSVGDQSSYVSIITANIKHNIPLIREYLSASRKYFMEFCKRFVSNFIPKFLQQLYKCKPVSTVGAEQLLLDTHMLKTILMELPIIGVTSLRKPPPSYTKSVLKGMSRAEMLLKVVMSPCDPAASFVDQYMKLLPESDTNEFQKILDMKGVKRTDQTILLDLYRGRMSVHSLSNTNSDSSLPNNPAQSVSQSLSSLTSPLHEARRIQKLEKLIKKRL